MKFEPTTLPGIIRIVPTVHEDSRGLFMEIWQASIFADSGIDAVLVQENFSHARKGALRELHYQIQTSTGTTGASGQGAVFDVSVDLRKSSPHFGRWFGEILSAENKHRLWVPAGFAHGFLVLSDAAGFEYNCTDYYAPQYDRSIRWDDPDIGIDWPLTPGDAPLLSGKDASAPFLKDAETYP